LRLTNKSSSRRKEKCKKVFSSSYSSPFLCFIIDRLEEKKEKENEQNHLHTRRNQILKNR